MITTAMEHFAALERASDLPLSLGTPRATSINTGHRGDLTTRHEPWRTENLQWACECHSEDHLLGQRYTLLTKTYA